jgi:CheY-like chemotaxis protein
MDEFLSGRHVLVVEDEMLVLLMIEAMLTEFGCESVSAAATGAQALALIETHLFDAATVDMNLSGDRSYAVADALAARAVPFVFSTGYSGQNIRDDYRDRPILRKPFRSEDLMEVLKHLLSR